jgi:hypothetical protein
MTFRRKSRATCMTFPWEELVCPEITFLSVHHPPMPFRWLGRGRFWRGCAEFYRCECERSGEQGN